MNIAKEFILGIDIGGSHITAGLVDMEERSVLNDSIIRNKVDCHGTADEILAAWAKTIKQVQDNYPNSFTKIGIAMPGPFDYEKGICLIRGFDKYESLYQLNIRQQLVVSTNIAAKNIGFRNDAEAFLEGELFCGAARGYQQVIGITLGTGLGSAISHNGVTRDAELSVLEYRGEKIEEFVSTRGLIRLYKDLTGTNVNNAQTIADLVPGDKYAAETFRLFAQHLGWFLKKFVIRESPEVLVIGGNIANAFNLFIHDIEQDFIISGIAMPKIVRAILGENAALIGGACKFISVQKSITSIPSL